MAPIYTSFEGGRAPKKRNFLVKIFQKLPKNAYFGLFFPNFACRAENLAQIGIKQCFGKSSENQFGRPKKKGRQNFQKFLKIRPPPLEKILDPPLLSVVNPKTASRLRQDRNKAN